MVRSSGSPRPTPMSRRMRSEEHTSELQSPQISYAVFCLKKNNILFLHERRAPPAATIEPGSPAARSRAPTSALESDLDSAGLAVCDCPLACFFFFNDTATPEIYPLSLHDALPICWRFQPRGRPGGTAGRRAECGSSAAI